MKQKTLTALGVAVTALLMVSLAACVLFYTRNPDNGAYMIGMGALSSGMMLFLVIFALIYGRAGSKPSDVYMETYQGICSRCGQRFGSDGKCPGCGRRRPGNPEH